MTIHRGALSPVGIAAGPDGAMWFTNHGNNKVGRITITGKVTTYSDSGIWGPEGIAAGPDGNLWFTGVGNNMIGRITTTGTVCESAGCGSRGGRDRG